MSIFMYIARDIFVVQALADNVENIDYYILRCTKVKHELLEGTIDANGQSYPIGSVVVEGTYYQQNRITDSGIEFIDTCLEKRFYNIVIMF